MRDELETFKVWRQENNEDDHEEIHAHSHEQAVGLVAEQLYPGEDFKFGESFRMVAKSESGTKKTFELFPEAVVRFHVREVITETGPGE
jgi:hypothetical protein